MLSRVAENLYWMTRYLERAENTARLINTTTQVLLDLPRGASFGWDVLLKVMGLDEQFAATHAEPDEISITRFLILDEDNRSSIVAGVRAARENCRTLREVLPREAWERVNSLYLFTKEIAPQALGRARRYNVLDEIIARRQAIVGLLTGCTSHDVGYQFMKLGRYLERADMTTRIIDVNTAVLVPRHQVPEDPAIGLLWIAVLKSLSAYQMYRRHISVHIRAEDAVNFLMRDTRFPRTVRFCLNEIEACLAVLPHHAEPLKAARVAQRRLETMRLAGLAADVRHQYLDVVQGDLARIHDTIARAYFHLHAQPQAESMGLAVAQ